MSEKQFILKWIDDNENMIKDIHHKIWEYAEVGLQETKTAKLLIDILKKFIYKSICYKVKGINFYVP